MIRLSHFYDSIITISFFTICTYAMYIRRTGVQQAFRCISLPGKNYMKRCTIFIVMK